MHYSGKERRKYQRYDTETKVHFYIDYRLVTRVKFRVIGECKGKHAAGECSGITRNISAEGMRFSSEKKLKKGDLLCMRIYLPEGGKPIPMTGVVRWSGAVYPKSEEGFKFDSGVKLLRVKGRSVARSIHIDRKYNEPWSIVLDSVFGSFHKFLHKTMLKLKTSYPAAILKAIKQK
jgi:hypothetical protein